MRKWTGIAAGLVVGVLLSLTVYVTAAPRAANTPVRIGVVDFRRVLDGYEKMKDVETEMTNKQKSLRAEAKKRHSEIQQLSARLAMHTPGSEAYEKTEREITTKKAEFETWTKVETRKMLDKERNVIREVYRDLELASANYARSTGLNLVLKSDQIGLTSSSVRELDLRVTLKKVLYFADTLDITDAIVRDLNVVYRRKKATGGR